MIRFLTGNITNTLMGQVQHRLLAARGSSQGIGGRSIWCSTVAIGNSGEYGYADIGNTFELVVVGQAPK